MQFFYVRYTRNQEAVSPAMQTVLHSMKRRFSDGRFPLCKWENFMSFNWRAIFLFVTLLAGYPWLYFVAELTVFNIVLVYTIVRHESICRRMETVLEDA